jgi:hypothetical protein
MYTIIQFFLKNKIIRSVFRYTVHLSIFLSNLTDIAQAVVYAQQLKALGNLIIIALGPTANISALQQLSPIVIQWIDYNNPPSTLASDIINQINCNSSVKILIIFLFL